ncbi:MAG TPA: hypothetical protein VIO36_06880 [Anaerolineaceae bacterium]
MKSRRLLVVFVMILLASFLAACQGSEPQSEPTQAVVPTAKPGEAGSTRLRITNAGSAPIKNLTVLFPEEEIFFGDIAAGATTEYLPVKNGVYGYAAYRYELDGEQVTQPVIDWVGEEGKQGSFTYTIDFDPTRAAMQRIMQQSVRQD